VLTLEQRIVDLTSEKARLLHKLTLKEQKIQSLEQDLGTAVEAESEDREVNHDLNKECLRLRLERQQIEEQLEKALKKIGKKKAVEAQLSQIREEKLRLEEEIRRLHKEKSDEKEHHLKVIEDKIKIQADKNDIENRLNGLIKDNQTLEHNL
jgi:hypothetical protein